MLFSWGVENLVVLDDLHVKRKSEWFIVDSKICHYIMNHICMHTWTYTKRLINREKWLVPLASSLAPRLQNMSVEVEQARRVQSATYFTYLINEGQISYTLSDECILGWTVCKTLPSCSKSSGPFSLHHTHIRKDTRLSPLFTFQREEGWKRRGSLMLLRLSQASTTIV